jgi:type II secretory pathway component PulL
LEALQRGLRRTALLLVLLALTLAGLLTLKSYELRAQNQQIESQLRKAYLRLQPGAQSTGPVNLLLRAKLKELQQRRQALQGLQGLELLRALAQSQGPGAELQELEATSQGLFLRGRAASAAQAEELRKALQERFPRVELLGTETLPDGQVAFRLKVSR